jgi:hypothetical protein
MGNPQQLRRCVVVTDEALALRIRRLIVKFGSIRKATDALGVGDSTFENARDCGRMMEATRDRLLAALEKAEAS